MRLEALPRLHPSHREGREPVSPGQLQAVGRLEDLPIGASVTSGTDCMAASWSCQQHDVRYWEAGAAERDAHGHHLHTVVHVDQVASFADLWLEGGGKRVRFHSIS